jgi:hypothetical protein
MDKIEDGTWIIMFNIASNQEIKRHFVPSLDDKDVASELLELLTNDWVFNTGDLIRTEKVYKPNYVTVAPCHGAHSREKL